tara:strand:+ start:2428 stop:3291 length:864 start_codon:yes stop_codon:yes gene_type:complete
MNLDREILLIKKNFKKHSSKSIFYKKLDLKIKKKISLYYKNFKTRSYLSLGPIGKIKFPFFKMGNINSTHLFGLDELIIFCFYNINKSKYKNVLDLGANIGIHSLIMIKNGMKVTCYEPDLIHVEQLIKNLKINKSYKNIIIKKKAVSNKKGREKFLRILGNTTGNHILGSKKKVYGDVETKIVNCDSFKSIMKNKRLIKIDVEGAEAKLISSTKYKDWENTDAILEIGSFENAKKIFKHCKNNNIQIFSQKKNWKKVKYISDLPKSYKEGSAFLTCNDKMNWGQYG